MSWSCRAQALAIVGIVAVGVVLGLVAASL